MKNFLQIIILFLLFNCKEKNIEKNTNSQVIANKVSKIQYGKKFFEYDQIDYYQIETRKEQIRELYENQDKSKIDKYRYTVIVQDTPENLKDLGFLKYMKQIGFLKKEINLSDFTQIDKVFIEKTPDEIYAYGCIPVFRDIFVFKKEGKVIGIVKICFACHQYRIIGTDVDTKDFGSENDYKILATILKKYNK